MQAQRRRAPQQETAPPVVQVRIVKGREIARCPSHSWAPSHWIPEHRIEECDNDSRDVLRQEEARIAAWKRRLIARLDQMAALRRERCIRLLRDAHAARLAATDNDNDNRNDGGPHDAE